jgi:hypothetical protein
VLDLVTRSWSSFANNYRGARLWSPGAGGVGRQFIYSAAYNFFFEIFLTPTDRLFNELESSLSSCKLSVHLFVFRHHTIPKTVNTINNTSLKNLVSSSRVRTDGRTDMAKSIATFCKFWLRGQICLIVPCEIATFFSASKL